MKILLPVFRKCQILLFEEKITDEVETAYFELKQKLSESLEKGKETVKNTVDNVKNKVKNNRRKLEDIKNSNLYAKYIDIKENNYSLGIVGTVENDKLTIKVLNQNYTIVDEVIIDKKERLL